MVGRGDLQINNKHNNGCKTDTKDFVFRATPAFMLSDKVAIGQQLNV